MVGEKLVRKYCNVRYNVMYILAICCLHSCLINSNTARLTVTVDWAYDVSEKCAEILSCLHVIYPLLFDLKKKRNLRSYCNIFHRQT
jgi:hypothetical protein